MNIKDKFDALEAAKRAHSGEHILIVCRNEYEALNSAQALNKILGHNVQTLRAGTLEIGTGSIEFGWAKLSSGRSMGDFTAAAFLLDVASKNISIPTREQQRPV